MVPGLRGAIAVSVGTQASAFNFGSRAWGPTAARLRRSASRVYYQALGNRVCRPHVLTEPIETGPMIELFSFFEEREAGPLVLSDDIAVRKGIDGAGARGGSEVVKGHGGTAA